MTTDSTGFLIENLAQFSNILREKGIRVGIAETMDAARIINILGLSDKNAVKAALSSLFAKSKSEQNVFNEAFNSFFAGENARRKQDEQISKAEEEKAKQRREAEEELKYDGKPLKIDEGLKEAYANLSITEREQLRRYFDFSMDNLRSSPFHERFMQKIIEQRVFLDDIPAAAGSSMAQIDTDKLELLNKNISDITEKEIPHAVALIQLLVRHINGELSRSDKRSGKSGRLDFRRTIHNSLKTGGLFYHLRYKKRRRSKKRIILLCDVSASMLKFTQFAVRFIQSMSKAAERSEVLLFSEGIMRVNPFVLRQMKTFEAYVMKSSLWGKGTDIGRAFEELLALRPSPLGGTSVLIVLSDTKTVSTKTAEAQLKTIRKKVSRILWMNPVPEVKWVNMKSVAAFKPYCNMLDCSTLKNLADACAEIAGSRK